MIWQDPHFEFLEIMGFVGAISTFGQSSKIYRVSQKNLIFTQLSICRFDSPPKKGVNAKLSP